MNKADHRINLYRLADAIVTEISSAKATSRHSFRLGTRVFIRIDFEGDIRSYCFKLKKSDATKVCEAYECVAPMQFGNMGSKGWVSFRLTQQRQLPRFRKLIAMSFALFD